MFVGNNIMELYYSMRVVCKSVHMRVMRRKSCTLYKFKSNARETWCVILVSVSWHILLWITAHPRGAFISVGDCTPTEKDLLLLTTCRSGSLLDWDKQFVSFTFTSSICVIYFYLSIIRFVFSNQLKITLFYHPKIALFLWAFIL